MRNIFIAFAIFAVPYAQADQCLTIYATNQAMFVAALQSQLLPATQEVLSLRIDRESNLKGTISVDFQDVDIRPQTLVVEQQCDGSLTVHRGEPLSCLKFINCMPPIPNEKQLYCSERYLDWANENCSPRPEVVY